VAKLASKASRTSLVVLGLAALGALVVARVTRTSSFADRVARPRAPASDPAPQPPSDDVHCAEQPLARPTGETTGLGCADVRSVIRQIHLRFPAPVRTPAASHFAEAVSNWLDPYGHWSAASEVPPRALVFATAERLLAEIEGPGDVRCPAAREIGASLERSVGELRAIYDTELERAPRVPRAAAFELGIEPAFDDGQVTTPARVLARELGRRLGSIGATYGESFAPYLAAARERYFPELDADGWQRLVLAAALRGYVEAIDPHGQWAPRDEEWSLYAGDPSFYDPDRLWGDMVRTALGMRVVDQPVPPLEVDDLVLAVDGIATSGLSIEHAEQLSRVLPAPAPAPGPREVVVLRQGDTTPRTLKIDVAAPDEAVRPDDALEADELEVELVPYGRSYVAVVSVPFVREDLGERFAEVIDSLGPEGPPAGLLIDLRGNAGGSMDGATAALSVFLPGGAGGDPQSPDVPLFPLIHSGRLVEVLTTRGEKPSPFQGPLAVLVDGRTASAAEMIAGALDRYRRALVLGQPTYGKGCVQEYFEDEARAGVLRLTTRLFTLPDGSSVQRHGIVPAVPLELPPAEEHEADVPGTLAAVEGPDVRVKLPEAPSWPSPSGRVGPCRERVVCQALGQAARASARAGRAARARNSPLFVAISPRKRDKRGADPALSRK
jgi:carboxyl-terminal processing protease